MFGVERNGKINKFLLDVYVAFYSLNLVTKVFRMNFPLFFYRFSLN